MIGMETLRKYWMMIQKTGGDKLFGAFLIFFVIDCLLIYWIEPTAFSHRFGNTLWFGFAIATSIGFGDYTVSNNIARILTSFIGIYGAIIMAYIPGLVGSYYLQNMSTQRNALLKKYKEPLAHIDTLSKEDRQKLVQSIRQDQKHFRWNRLPYFRLF